MCSKQRSCICMHTCQFAIVRSVARQPLLPKQSPPNCMDTQFFENVQPQPLYMFGIQEYKKLLRRLSLSLSLSVSLSLMVSPSLSLTLSARRTDGQTTDRHTDTLTRPGTVAHKHKVGVPEHPRTAVERAKTISRRKPYVSVC